MGAGIEAGNLGAQAAHSSSASSITGQARGLALGVFMGKSFSVAKLGGVGLRRGCIAGMLLRIPGRLHAGRALRIALANQVGLPKPGAHNGAHNGKAQGKGAHAPHHSPGPHGR